MATKLGRVVTNYEGLPPFDLVVMRDHVINSKHMSAHGHQTRQDGNLPWWAPAYEVT